MKSKLRAKENCAQSSAHASWYKFRCILGRLNRVKTGKKIVRENIAIIVYFQALEIRFEVKFEKIKVNLNRISIEKEEFDIQQKTSGKYKGYKFVWSIILDCLANIASLIDN